MSNIAGPYGLVPVADQIGIPRPVRMPGGIVSGYATNIFKYAPVVLEPVTGTLQALTTTAQKPFGVFSGVEYTPLGGRPAVSPFWPGGTTVDTNFDFFVYFWPAWTGTVRFAIQADGSVPQGGMGSQYNFTNIGAGSTITGLSAMTVGAAGVAAGVQGQVAMYEFNTTINSAIGDAFTDLIVGVAYPQIIGGFQTSIG